MSSISFFITFFTYIKMSKDSSAKFYQINKERLQKKLARNIGVFLKKKKKKVTIWLWTIETFYQKVKNKSLLSIEKRIIKWEKTPYYN